MFVDFLVNFTPKFASPRMFNILMNISWHCYATNQLLTKLKTTRTRKILSIHEHWPPTNKTDSKNVEAYLLDIVNLNYIMPAMEKVHLLQQHQQ